MSISLEYSGRFGNACFQYAFYRQLAKINNLRCETRWIWDDVLPANEPPPEEGEIGTAGFETIRDSCVREHSVDHYSKDFRNKNVKICGYFQDPMYYQDKKFVKSLWRTEPIQKRAPNEFAIHLRLADYFDPGLRSVISPLWYEEILRRLEYSPKKHKIFIVVENPDEPFLQNFTKYRPEIVSQSAKKDFNFIRQFDKIVCSNSSFSWWAAYLSEATTIYTFEPWLQFPTDEHLKLAYVGGATPVKGRFYK